MSDKTIDKRYRITLTHKQFDLICRAVNVMLIIAAISGKNKSDDELEYETIYSTIRNYEVAKNLNVGIYYHPVQFGKEPIPEIERIER